MCLRLCHSQMVPTPDKGADVKPNFTPSNPDMSHNHFTNKTINLATHTIKFQFLSLSSHRLPWSPPPPQDLSFPLNLSQNPQNHFFLSLKTIFSSPQVINNLLPTIITDSERNFSLSQTFNRSVNQFPFSPTNSSLCAHRRTDNMKTQLLKVCERESTNRCTSFLRRYYPPSSPVV